MLTFLAPAPVAVEAVGPEVTAPPLVWLDGPVAELETLVVTVVRAEREVVGGFSEATDVCVMGEVAVTRLEAMEGPVVVVDAVRRVPAVEMPARRVSYC